MSRLFLVDGHWPGRLALSDGPRGDDWLEDDLANWKREGMDVVVSLLTSKEEQNVGLKSEAVTVKKLSVDVISLPIADLQVPRSRNALTGTLEKINAELSSGKNVLIYCRQGIGRTGMVAACLLVVNGWIPRAAVNHLSSVRGTPLPETPDQRNWIDHYAASLAGTK